MQCRCRAAHPAHHVAATDALWHIRGGDAVCSHGEVDSCPDGARGDLQRPLDIIDGRGTSG
jgi:hypothetical protein